MWCQVTERSSRQRRRACAARASLVVSLLGALSLGALSLGGCGDDPPPAPREPARPAPPAPPPFTLSRALEDLRVSDDVAALGGMNVLADVFAEVRAASARLMSSPVDLQELWLNQFAQTELLLAPAHIHTGRPFRFVQVARDGALHDVRLIGVRDLAALKESLGEYLEEADEGGAPILIQRRYKQDPDPLYLCALAHDMLASTKRRDLLAPRYRALYEELAVTRLEGLGGARFFPRRLSERWGGDLERHAQAGLEGAPLEGSERSLARQRALISGGARWLQTLADDSDRVTLSVAIEPDRVALRGSWSPRAGSALELALQSLRVEAHPLLSALPAETPFALALNLRPEHLRALSASLNAEASGALLGESPQALARYLEAARGAAERLSGAAVWFAGVSPSPAPAPSPKGAAAEGAAAGAAAPPADAHVLAALSAPLSRGSLRWGLLLSHLGDPETSAALNALWALYADPALVKVIRRLGLLAKVSADPAVEGAPPSVHLAARMPRTPPLLAPLRPQLKELYDAHVAVGPSLVGVGFGEEWREALAPLSASLGAPLSASPGGGAPEGLARALAAVGAPPFLLVYLEPLSFISHLKPGKSGSLSLPLQMLAQGLSAPEGLSLAASVEGRDARVSLSVPLGLLSAVARGFSGLAPGAPAALSAP